MVAASPDEGNRIPVTVVTGYLGAGKTTLVNNILGQLAGRRFAIIVNEFGDIGIDGDLIETGEEELIELSSGCICCVVRGDLIRTLRQLLGAKRDLDGILIETTGLANPSPVIQTMVIDQVIGAQCRLDSVTTVVDAAHILQQLAESKDAADQIAFADHVILNKMDAATAPPAELETQIRALNPFARITQASRAEISADAVLGRRSFDLDRIADQLISALPEDDSHDHDHTKEGHIEAGGISSVSLTTAEPIDPGRLDEWLQELLSREGYDILRTKGILAVPGEDRKLVVQAVNMMLEGGYAGSWAGEERLSHLVFIGRNLDETSLKAGFETCRSETGT